MTSSTDSRSYARLPAAERCTLGFAGQVIRGRIANVSLAGVYVCAEQLPELGARVTFEAENMRSITGVVVRRTDEGFALRFEPEEAKVVGIGDVMTVVANRELLAQ